MQETRARTNLAPERDDGEQQAQEGTEAAAPEWREVNLELSLLLGQQVGGHFVSGHVDTVAPLGEVVPNSDGSCDLWIDLGRRRVRHIPLSTTSSSSAEHADDHRQRLPVVHKGSICIDGVSLTVAEWREDEERFKVCLIPHTQAVTTLGKKRAGDEVNIEFDRSLKTMEGAETWAWTAESADDVAERLRRQDEDYMRQAIALGEKGRYTAPPNPWVACLIAKDSRILGR
jgi:riboflavin synthase alpha subunit